MRKHIALTVFITCVIGEIISLLTNRLSVGQFAVLLPATWLVINAIVVWGQPGELKFSIWDFGFVWKINEKIEFVAAKAEEVRVLKEQVEASENSIRALIRGYIETTYIDFATRNFLPPPRGVLRLVQEHLGRLIEIGITQGDRAAWEAGMEERIRAARENPTV